jgi:protein TonB
MGYQALLFCPDEKTARTVTQVLSELDFEVVPCTEPFAAVKQMMASHFDAIVVDCDNEQNATLLFKSARNAPNNQSALAVAVVEGQAGVAKAFRIGANLVLTKPINVEQAKGTLRVARGLLRKNEAAKASSTAPAVAKGIAPEIPAKTAKASIVDETETSSPTKLQTIAAGTVGPEIFPTVEPSQTESKVGPRIEPKIEPKAEPKFEPKFEPKTEPKPSFAAHASAPVLDFAKSKESPSDAPKSVRPLSEKFSIVTSSGAASAPAPAREVQPAASSQEKSLDTRQDLDLIPDPVAGITPNKITPDEDVTSEVTPVPAFAIGETQAVTPGSKKMLVAVAAVVVLAAAGYFAWQQFGPSARPSSIASPSPAQPQVIAPTTAVPPAAPTPDSSSSSATTTSDSSPAPAPPNSSSKTSPATIEPAKASPAKPKAEEPISQPIVPVATGRKTPSASAAPQPIKIKNAGEQTRNATEQVAEDVAPPAITTLPSASDDAIPTLLNGSSSAPAPHLQTLNISQGVSRGLLVKQVQPTYPAGALRLNVEGQVLLMATITKDGDTTAVKVLKGDSRLAHAAVEAVKQWKYKPYLLNGEPVEIQTQVAVNFKLPR